MRTGIANLPLHGGKAPRWLFSRMTKLAREIAIVIVTEFGPEEMLRKLSDPFWFQAFGCVLGFDWHSSGVTTTTCGALKEGIKDIGPDLGLFVAGGKGATSRKTPSEIEKTEGFLAIDPKILISTSKITAKVDNNALQDGYQLYHHCFIFTKEGSWAVVQQGMNEVNLYARRYHWLGEKVNDFVNEPHSAICCDKKNPSLNLVAKESEEAREVTASLSREKPETLVKELKRIKTLELPARHSVKVGDINPDRIEKIFLKTYERQPEDFKTLLAMPGVGPKTIRALSLISELVYGVKPSFKDPVRYSFAHGGKDGHPYPVDRTTYDKSIEILRTAVSHAKVGREEKLQAFRRLGNYGG
ncbi:DUF763 domain-containing protein [Candidatus Oleimmundimicrobium sp.]|uniref:DUF763 domain-containing protein n=1 Tax=Candidatus Oleimmundimicrobium sp. TaxID=3060597 RepID=UPI00271CE01F|nr:DUF763 domain-containing protein [Candidatus Oleimmundimicrobium sp.]MDO8886710.1 DUF763 domain-containing protein [Candidatus Oleimmundimicrobium sp.]